MDKLSSRMLSVVGCGEWMVYQVEPGTDLTAEYLSWLIDVWNKNAAERKLRVVDVLAGDAVMACLFRSLGGAVSPDFCTEVRNVAVRWFHMEAWCILVRLEPE